MTAEFVSRAFYRHHPGLLRVNGPYSKQLRTNTEQVALVSTNVNAQERKDQRFQVPGRVVSVEFFPTRLKHNRFHGARPEPDRPNEVFVWADLQARRSTAGINRLFGKTEKAEVIGVLKIHYLAEGGLNLKGK